MSSSFFVSFCTKLKRQRKSDQASQNVAVYRTLLYLFPFRSKVSLCVPFVAPFHKTSEKKGSLQTEIANQTKLSIKVQNMEISLGFDDAFQIGFSIFSFFVCY